MTGTNFSVISGVDGTTKVPISTPFNDANGNTVVGHLDMLNVGGVAVPVSSTNPLPAVDSNNVLIAAASGTPADTAWIGTGSSTIVAALKGIWTALTGNLNVSVGNFPSVQTVNINSASLAALTATQAVSIAAIPLATGAAQDGTDANGIVGPAGASGIRGWLSAIFGKLSGTLTVVGTVGVTSLPALPAGTNSVGAVALSDPATPANRATITVFHNADNQILSATNYGLLTGDVTLLVNATGNLDRARGVNGDGMVATGIQANADMLWNGVNFDRATGSAAGGMNVTLKFGGVAVGASNPLPVQAQRTASVLTDHSGSIASANTAQSLMASNAARTGFFFTSSADCWINIFGGVPIAGYGTGSQKVPAGSLFETPPNMTHTYGVNVLSASAGATFTLQEW